MSDILVHYGTPHAGSVPHSGRYEWGSGENPHQRQTLYSSPEMFMDYVKTMRRTTNPDTGKRYTDTQIAETLGMSTSQFRARTSNATNAVKAARISEACRLKSSGMSVSAIAEQMGIPESTVRNYLKPGADKKVSSTTNVANYLKEQIKDKTYLDVGRGVEDQLGISKEQLKSAVAMLEDQGYKKHYIRIEQATNPGKYTELIVLTENDIPWKQVHDNRDKIMSPQGHWFEDNGYSMRDVRDPVSIDSDRVCIRYTEDGGSSKDGVIEIRPGVEDLSLGSNHYAQVRIAVDGTHYLKGMAIYSDNVPEGYDIIFNTNKDKSVDKMDVLKKMKDDPDNPFGSTIRQWDYVGEDGLEHQSAINLVNTDEDWNKWSRTLSSQVLSKQSASLAKRQLDLVYKEKLDEFVEIQDITQPTIKKKLLTELADNCDSAAVNLKAAALPRQATKVILPLNTIADNEVYAPTFKDGEEVVLIRYPHAGVFEMPRLIVNNKNAEGQRFIGNDARNAIGINSTVAEQLSGADFDGDTVTVIPTAGQKIKTSQRLDALKGFDPKIEYKAYEGMPRVGEEDNFHRQAEMGKVSNLITDMTIKGASEAELARAVKHSMVVIDAEKHNLNWKQSEKDQQIAQLKEKYQGGANRGASTVVSRAKSTLRVDARKDRYDIDPETGEKIYYTPSDAYYTNKKGKQVVRQQESTKMAEAKDAFDLVSRDKETGMTTRIETVYATHANKMKDLANTIRKEIVKIEEPRVDTSAKKQYADAVDTLDAKLRVAKLNAPNERLAQAAANVKLEEIKKSNPNMDKDEYKKVSSQVLNATRRKAGTIKRSDRVITPTDREWDAIQANAIAKDKLSVILDNMDPEEIKRRSTPRITTTVSTAKIGRAKALLNAGYTWAEVAEEIGISESTLRKQITT